MTRGLEEWQVAAWEDFKPEVRRHLKEILDEEIV